MRTLLAQSFTLDEVTALRGSVAERAADCGLSGARLEDYILAVHESVINAVEHGGGRGYFTLWTSDRMLRSETSDQGPGIPDEYVDEWRRPSDVAYAGRGIYLIRTLCDGASFHSGSMGTTVQLTMWLPRLAHRALQGAPLRRIRVTAASTRKRHNGFRA
ncbi:ATP-binding protein [Nonomuraea sp. NEAU-A123]|uniref:ATP-binding protein n=1 Tax=Nonomuraea sp. NEAU-A123 TaxID=2839649 RepID=UPI001BE47BC4|nr:ATP-binding protein [Nonomuraea sp. NEAU-A123]MBT2234572.1 ATP-binding protein [Nonomuraea sp. NEAU-A123]